jgi:hypothetical protein
MGFQFDQDDKNDPAFNEDRVTITLVENLLPGGHTMMIVTDMSVRHQHLLRAT